MARAGFVLDELDVRPAGRQVVVRVTVDSTDVPGVDDGPVGGPGPDRGQCGLDRRAGQRLRVRGSVQRTEGRLGEGALGSQICVTLGHNPLMLARGRRSPGMHAYTAV